MDIWIFTKAILEGQAIPISSNGGMQRDFTHIDDIVSGVVVCVDHPPNDDGSMKAGGSAAPHALYNVGNHRSEELGRLIDLIEAACGRRARSDHHPMQPGDVPATYADIDPIQNDLGYRPTTSIDTGIPRFVDWLQAFHA